MRIFFGLVLLVGGVACAIFGGTHGNIPLLVIGIIVAFVGLLVLLGGGTGGAIGDDIADSIGDGIGSIFS